VKEYYFLSGLPRSGNTLLSAILNQNPSIYSSPISPLVQILLNYDNLIKTEESALKLKNKNNLIKFGQGLISNYYNEINKPIIFDRSKVWAIPENLNNIKTYIDPNFKIIFTVRPILEILTSFISILPEDSYIDLEMQNSYWWSKDYLSKNDNRCDYLMRPFGQIDNTLFALSEILKPEYKTNVCFINYNEIIKNPKDVTEKIYNFLEIPTYSHDFNNIIKIEDDDENVLGHPLNLHKIRPQLKKISKDPSDILSDYVIKKYSNMGVVI
jgi:sulfotransferase